MGRGYSAHRSHSNRLTNKTKRARSSSVLQKKTETVAIKPLQNHLEAAAPKKDFSCATAALADTLGNVEAATAKRRGVSMEKRAADEAAAAGRTRSESVKKTVYLGNRMVRSVNVTRHFSKVKKDKADDAADDEAASGSDEEVYEDFMDEEPSEDESETIRRPDVFTKYVEAGKVVDSVLTAVAAAAVVGANTKDLCEFGDSEIFRRVGTLFKNYSDKSSTAAAPSAGRAVGTAPGGKRSMSIAGNKRDISVASRRYGVSSIDRSLSKGRGRSVSQNPLAVRFDSGVPRGIAFPTTVSVNEVLCNHTPFSADDAITLKAGDVIKIHCGVHVDGYPVSAARTVVVQPTAEEAPPAPLPATAVNAIEAARVSLAGAIHLMRPGAVNDDITDFIASVGAHYQTEAVEGVLSTRTKRWIPDSVSSSIICRRVTTENPQQDVAYCEVEPYQIWQLDMAFTNSSSYRMQVPLGARYNSHCNIYRKNEVLSANPTLEDLRSKAASHVLTQEIRNKFHCFPFNPNHADEPLKCRLGLVALKKAGQIDCMEELTCKPNSALDGEGRICKKAPTADNRAITARFSATVAVTEKRVHVLCGGAGIISDEFLSKKKMKEHKKAGASSSSSADIGGFAACGGLASFEDLYGACFPTAALGAPSAEFESDHVPLFVRTPTEQLKGLLASPLNFGKSIVASSGESAEAVVTTGAADEDEETVMAAREDLTVKRKHRRTEAAAEDDAAPAAPKMDAAAKAKLLSMHPGRKTAKK